MVFDMPRTYDYIIGPAEGHAHQQVTSPERYLQVQAEYLARNRAAGVDDALPHEATEAERAKASAPYVNLGQWVMNCACHNAPSVSFEWDLACCLECGAIYRQLPVPRERVRIERVLLKRARRGRNWDHREQLSDVIAQNLEQGDAIPDADEMTDGL